MLSLRRLRRHHLTLFHPSRRRSNFAVHGDPNGPGLPTWGEYRTGGSGSGGAVAQIATSAAGVNVTMTSGLRAVECALWRNITIPPSVIWGSP